MTTNEELTLEPKSDFMFENLHDAFDELMSEFRKLKLKNKKIAWE